MEKELALDRGETSRSKSVCETLNGSHRFEIKGYSLAKGMGPGKYMSSDTFAVGGYQWAVYFYPDGKNPEDNSAYVSVFVALANEGTDVRALFELTLVDQSGKGKHKVHSHFDRAMVSGPYTLKYRGSMWGYKRFYRRTTLETSDFLKDDCLVMNCTVGVVRTRIETPRQLTISTPPPDMGHCLEGLLKSGIGSDIVFEVDDETFKAHKLILAARSPVFKAQFFGLIGNPDVDRSVVQDVEPPVFKAMLLFMYSDALPDLHELTGSISLSTTTNLVQHLLAAADRYGLERLKLLCEAKLSEQVTADTVTPLSRWEEHGNARRRIHTKHKVLYEHAKPQESIIIRNYCYITYPIQEYILSHEFKDRKSEYEKRKARIKDKYQISDERSCSASCAQRYQRSCNKIWNGGCLLEQVRTASAKHGKI